MSGELNPTGVGGQEFVAPAMPAEALPVPAIAETLSVEPQQSFLGRELAGQVSSAFSQFSDIAIKGRKHLNDNGRVLANEIARQVGSHLQSTFEGPISERQFSSGLSDAYRHIKQARSEGAEGYRDIDLADVRRVFTSARYAHETGRHRHRDDDMLAVPSAFETFEVSQPQRKPSLTETFSKVKARVSNGLGERRQVLERGLEAAVLTAGAGLAIFGGLKLFEAYGALHPTPHPEPNHAAAPQDPEHSQDASVLVYQDPPRGHLTASLPTAPERGRNWWQRRLIAAVPATVRPPVEAPINQVAAAPVRVKPPIEVPLPQPPAGNFQDPPRQVPTFPQPEAKPEVSLPTATPFAEGSNGKIVYADGGVSSFQVERVVDISEVDADLKPENLDGIVAVRNQFTTKEGKTVETVIYAGHSIYYGQPGVFSRVRELVFNGNEKGATFTVERDGQKITITLGKGMRLSKEQASFNQILYQPGVQFGGKYLLTCGQWHGTSTYEYALVPFEEAVAVATASGNQPVAMGYDASRNPLKAGGQTAPWMRARWQAARKAGFRG